MSRYEKNEVMKLLGKQYLNLIVKQEDVTAIEDIWSANLDCKGRMLDVLIDVFIYGYIQGKRAERQKKKAPI